MFGKFCKKYFLFVQILGYGGEMGPNPKSGGWGVAGAVGGGKVSSYAIIHLHRNDPVTVR